ncbi:ABC-ATPase domain-containing protein, partial [Planktothrix sp. FACHB-1355]|uniref:ABC-ATPase domain-containing protein n=1 Tax=Aerosakkonema funiforme FACHB-1375 TaxID=2949571 RepID=A0A926ZEQ6_9CYAN|nr:MULTISPECIES: ABC-ATPase domain-containing protein [Oscillatoriales]MBD2180020.1 ABC-ATPase domain-containing protein [Aerosakkonema funiforme FACHB-1375]MBD3562632.1 ABC-ATPase domain-containing protein [Planktothrix sp. FACHB-1355]
MPNQEKLRQQLLQLDGRGYKAYRDIEGSYEFSDFTLIVDRTQGDPFAAPSHFRVKVAGEIAAFPPQLYQTKSRAIALRDYLTRQFDLYARSIGKRRGTGNSGLIGITRIGQEVLERTSVLIDDEFVEVRFVVGLPAGGRRILGHQAVEMLCEQIPQIVDRTLKYYHLDANKIQHHVEVVEDADWIRQQLTERGLVAFIPNGAILPRRSGVDDQPLPNEAVAFQSPKSLQVEFNCPNQGLITGMGVPTGVTLIVGGGYHGKSTLLRAIELGVYNHIPNDGRELVVTHPAAVKIRAEDGRNIVGVDISPFINHLPQGKSTTNFSTTNASGSTSQAANIIEALEADAKVLLVDEDTAATNFMIRDRRMQALIAKDKEPITPFIDKVKQLYADCNVSTILVMGGSGDYFEVADTVIAMQNFQPEDVTAKAKTIAQQYTYSRTPEGGEKFGQITPRIPLPESIDPSYRQKQVRLKVRDVDEMVFGTEDIDLSAVEQIVDTAQSRAIAAAMVYAVRKYIDGKRTLAEILALVMADIEFQGLDILTPFPQCDLAIFRQFELAAAINRLRSLSVR